jgi:hypothetical protein
MQMTEKEFMDLVDDGLTPLSTIMSISDGRCRWPYERPGEIKFCGRECDGSSKYCVVHHAVARGGQPKPVAPMPSGFASQKKQKLRPPVTLLLKDIG